MSIFKVSAFRDQPICVVMLRPLAATAKPIVMTAEEGESFMEENVNKLCFFYAR